MNSMTGFGKGVYELSGKRYTIEVRSVNHRFIELKMRLPKGLLAIEEKIDKALKNTFSRGSFSIYFTMETTEEGTKDLDVDLSLAKSYYEASLKARDFLGIEDHLTLKDIMLFSDVVRIGREDDEDVLWTGIGSAMEIAFEQLSEMRAAEGEALKKDITERISLLRGIVTEIEADSEGMVEVYQEKLEERIATLLDQVPVNEDRIAYEVAVFADKSNVTEEIVRLGIHLEQFESFFALKEPVGRKMDFLVQEMNREVNTIGSKSSVPAIAEKVVILKSELEKIREQIQNIE